jgi:hypothetical protein
VSWGYDATVLWVLWGMLGTIAVVGGLVAYRAFHAARAHPSTSLRFLGAGLFIIAVGMPALWMGAYVATGDLLWCSVAAVAGILVGFVLVLYALQTTRG